LNFINVEDFFDARSENVLNETFMSHLNNKMSNINVFHNETYTNSYQFLQSYNFDDQDTTLLLPKSLDLISPKTPIVVKRAKDNRDEFDVYFSPAGNSTVASSYFQDDGGKDEKMLSFFTFPQLAQTQNENKENAFSLTDFPAYQQITNFSHFCIHNNNNNNNNNNNSSNNNLTVYFGHLLLTCN